MAARPPSAVQSYYASFAAMAALWAPLHLLPGAPGSSSSPCWHLSTPQGGLIVAPVNPNDLRVITKRPNGAVSQRASLFGVVVEQLREGLGCLRCWALVAFPCVCVRVCTRLAAGAASLARPHQNCPSTCHIQGASLLPAPGSYSLHQL